MMMMIASALPPKVPPKALFSACCTHRMPYWRPGTFSTNIAPSAPWVLKVLVSRMMSAEEVHTTSVSMYTDSACTRPCLAGWEQSAAALTMAPEPWPASLE